MNVPAAALCAVAAALVLGTTPVARAADAESAGAPGLRFAVQRIHHNDAMPLDAMDADDHSRTAPRSGRNLAYLDDEARLEWRTGGAWAFALLVRQQATLVAEGQTLALARMVETGQRPAGDAQWRTEARFRGFAGGGVELRRELALRAGWTAQLSGQLLALGNWHEREFHGAASYDAKSGTYGFDVVSDQLYSRLHVEYEQPRARHGTGLLVAAALQWDDGQTVLRAALRDGGWLHWNGVPQQSLALAADRQGVDADGFVVYGPLLQGRNRQSPSTRMQPWRANLSAGQRAGETLRLVAGADWLPDFGALPWLGALTRCGNADLQLQWQVHEQRLAVGLQWRGLAMRLGADRLGGAAHSREAALSYTRVLR